MLCENKPGVQAAAEEQILQDRADAASSRLISSCTSQYCYMNTAPTC